jgi:hypothetical protein
MYDEIAREIREAAQERNKIGMFHYQVLINAKQLEDVNPTDFCRAVGVPDSYTVEFQKMLRVAKTIEAHGKKIA